jgi:hypothetical protein
MQTSNVVGVTAHAHTAELALRIVTFASKTNIWQQVWMPDWILASAPLVWQAAGRILAQLALMLVMRAYPVGSMISTTPTHRA